MPNKISPMTNYYIRKLYRKKDPYLSRMEDLGDDFSTFLDLEQVLKSLYGKGDELDLMIRQLETLVQYHQGLTSQSFTPPAQVQEVEQRIFTILGESNQTASPSASVNPLVQEAPTNPDPPESTVTVEKLLGILNQLQDDGKTYLGAAIATNYLQAARPGQDWLNQFEIQRSQAVTYTGNPSESLDEHQKELARQWVSHFIQSCAQVITKFPDIVNKNQLLSQL